MGLSVAAEHASDARPTPSKQFSQSGCRRPPFKNFTSFHRAVIRGELNEGGHLALLRRETAVTMSLRASEKIQNKQTN